MYISLAILIFIKEVLLQEKKGKKLYSAKL